MQGTDVLAQSREVYPLARRVLLTAYSDIDAAIKAINVAHLDHYLSKPWDPPEECLFPVVDDLLDALAGRVSAGGEGPAARRPPVVAAIARDQGLSREQPDPVPLARRGARTRTRSEPARRRGDRRTTNCRRCSSRTGRSCAIPSARRSPSAWADGCRGVELYDLVIVGAGPAGLAAAVYGASEGLGRCCSIATRPAARPAAARGSRTTSAFRPASAAAS